MNQKQIKVLHNVYFLVYFSKSGIFITVMEVEGGEVRTLGDCSWQTRFGNANYTIKVPEKEHLVKYLSVLFLTEPNDLDLPGSVVNAPVQIGKVQNFS